MQDIQVTRTVNLTPTWEALIPIYIALITDGETSEARQEGRQVFSKLARVLDLINSGDIEVSDSGAKLIKEVMVD